MANSLDFSLNVKKESTYGTYVAPDRALEYLDGTMLELKPSFYDGQGMKSGLRAKSETRSVEMYREVEGKFVTEAMTKGLGVVLEAAVGSSSSTLVGGSTYQQLFTPPSGAWPSLTVQQGWPQTTAGTIDPASFVGVVVPSFTFSIERDGIAQWEFDLLGRNYDGGQSFASLTYPASTIPFSFKDVSFYYGGTITAPTTTALGSSDATASANVNSFKLTVDNKLAGRRNFGNAGLSSKPSLESIPEITGSFTAEYEDTTFLDDFSANTAKGIVVTLQSTQALSTGYATLQFVIPKARIRSAPIASNGGGIANIEYTFEVYQAASTFSYPYYVAVRTADTAL